MRIIKSAEILIKQQMVLHLPNRHPNNQSKGLHSTLQVASLIDNCQTHAVKSFLYSTTTNLEHSFDIFFLANKVS